VNTVSAKKLQTPIPWFEQALDPDFAIRPHALLKNQLATPRDVGNYCPKRKHLFRQWLVPYLRFAQVPFLLSIFVVTVC